MREVKIHVFKPPCAQCKFSFYYTYSQTRVASWLLCLSLDQVVRVGALTRDVALCYKARHFTLTVPLSTQMYKFVPAN